MERIASFCVDHTKLNPGIYLSRQDGDIITYDIRMKKPNNGDYIDVAAAHAIEHLFATFARNSEISDSVIYVGPMGCRTGFYLLTRGITHERAIQLVKDSFELIADFDGAVPGASEIECGNYREISLPKARAEASAFLPKIRNWTSEMLNYRQ
ncbi:MAG: S-ribosylhomocysteine lyase [Oscillospiraceae bacterium]